MDGVQNIGQKCELRVWQEKYKKDGTQHSVLKDDPLNTAEVDDDKPYAVVVRQVFTDKNVLEKTLLTINSPHLLKAFREVIKAYPTVPSDFQTPFEMESPFRMLFHYWKDLDDYRRSVSNDTIRMHLNLLFDFMKLEIGHDKAKHDGMIAQKQITFATLWTIFRPGELQYTVENGHPWLMRLEKTAYEESKKLGKFLEVHCTYSDYNGTDVGQARRMKRIIQKRNFAAENPSNILELPIFPRKFLEGQRDLEDRLAERGAKFLELQGVLVRNYDGLAQFVKEPPMDFWHPEMDEWDAVWLPYTETGRIVLDRKTFEEDNYSEHVEIRPRSADDVLEPILCPPYAFGYSLTRKEWCRFYIDNIRNVEWKKNAFESLVLKANQKRVLQALVSSHAFPENARDEAQQKGKGLVVLLHGKPGSGKTLTAESAAEITGKALLSTTMGELNKENRAWWFEARLKQVLQYATTWKAVVLLDEADVFLEARQDGGGDAAERNALVAVFLRHLEYFSGIVFLTSNRVGVFDRAMVSRIHMAIEYSSPDLEMRRLIWLQTLEAIPELERGLDPDDATDSLIRDKINGREISNAVNTARTLARFEKQKLQLHHIETVLQVRRDFEASVNKMKALAVAEARQGSSSFGLGRNNSLLMSSEEPSEWLP